MTDDKEMKNILDEVFGRVINRVALKKACEEQGIPKTEWRLMDILVKNGCDPTIVIDSINEFVAEDKEPPEDVRNLVELLKNSGFNVEVFGNE